MHTNFTDELIARMSSRKPDPAREAAFEAHLAELLAGVERHKANEDYIGPNPMEHHSARIANGGIRGAADVFDYLFSRANSKHAAGAAIRSARASRVYGDKRGVHYWLARAASARLEAQRRPL